MKNNHIAQKTAELLLEIEAITLRPHQPFEFSSKIKSPIYIDNRLIISFPKVRKQIVNFYIQIIQEKIGKENVELLSGTSTAAIPWAAFIAQKMNLPMIYVRGKKKQHGKENQLEGRIKAGQKTVVIEDHISSGDSLIENVSAVRKKQGEVNFALGITTYKFKEAETKFKNNHIKVLTLTDFETIINTAISKKFIAKTDKNLVMQWSNNPRKWGKA